MGDINLDSTEAEQAKLTNRLSKKELCIIYDFSNLVTCITHTHESSTDVGSIASNLYDVPSATFFANYESTCVETNIVFAKI